VKWCWLPVTIALSILAGWVAWYWRIQARLERSQDVPIVAAARRYGLEPALVKAVVWRESRFNPKARGRFHEIGLMQLREDAAQEWADAEHIQGFDVEACVDPVTNTLAGAYYLKKLLQRYARTDDPLPYALADYNAGRANVLKWNKGAAATNSSSFIEQIGILGTKDYVKAVLRRYVRYRASFASR
jgi:peptidoglycan lytic transglycosylase